MVALPVMNCLIKNYYYHIYVCKCMWVKPDIQKLQTLDTYILALDEPFGFKRHVLNNLHLGYI